MFDATQQDVSLGLERFLRTQCFFKEQRERSESSLENLCLCLYVPTKCGQCMA